MSKEFIINLILLLGVNFLVKPLYAFGVDMEVQYLLRDEYGLYFALWNFSCLFQMLGDMGLQQYNGQATAGDASFFRRNFGRLLAVKFVFLVLMWLVAMLAAWLAGYRGAALWLFIVLMLNQLLISVAYFFRSALSGLGHYRLDSFLSALDKFLMLLFGFLLLRWAEGGAMRLEYFVYTQSLSYALAALAAGLAVAMAWRRAAAPSGALVGLGHILKRSLPFAVAVILMMIYNRADAVLLERLLPTERGAAAASHYAFAYRFFDMGNMVGFLFAGLLFPMFARLRAQRQETIDLLRLAGALILVFTLGFSGIIYIYGVDLQEVMAPQLPTARVLPLLILALNAAGIIQVWGTLLTAQASLWRLNALFSVAILINLGLNLWLIPSFEVMGAVYAALATQFFIAVVQWNWANTHLAISWKSMRYKSWLLFLTGLFLVVVLLERCDIFADWRLEALLFAVFYFVWALLTRVFEPRGLLRLFRSKVV